MPPTRTGNNDRTAPAFELRRSASAGRASDWLDEVTADLCASRALSILLQAVARDTNPHAAATARQLQRLLTDR